MIALEHVHDSSPAARNFQKLAAVMLDTGGRSAGIRFGRATLTWTASASSATVTVSHGLGKTPQGVWFGEVTDLGASWWKAMVVDASFTTTTFQVKGRTFDGTTPTDSATVFWVVIG